MAVQQRVYQASESLQERLVQEWLHPQAGGTEPVILEDRAQYYPYLSRLCVIWAEWVGLPQRERSRIIMSAFQQVNAENASHVSVAMGLTAKEAERMGIEYAPLEAAA